MQLPHIFSFTPTRFIHLFGIIRLQNIKNKLQKNIFTSFKQSQGTGASEQKNFTNTFFAGDFWLSSTFCIFLISSRQTEVAPTDQAADKPHKQKQNALLPTDACYAACCMLLAWRTYIHNIRVVLRVCACMK